MVDEAFECPYVLGLDVGKTSHWACLISRTHKILLNRPVFNTEADLDELFSRLDPKTLIVVDQVKNIAKLAISRAHAHNLTCAYLTGSASHEAAKLFGGETKNDERDAYVMASTALGIPDSLLPISVADEKRQAVSSLAAHRSFLQHESTRYKNRLRAILLESCPAFEKVFETSSRPQLEMLSKIGSPWQLSSYCDSELQSEFSRIKPAVLNTFKDAINNSTKPSELLVGIEEQQIRHLALSLLELEENLHNLEMQIDELLADNATYTCLQTIPGIGKKNAAELVISVDIDKFEDHNHLASYCGLAPKNRQSGTSIRSVSASKQGNKKLKNLLIFSCTSLMRTEGRFSEYYNQCRDRGMHHNQALKAVARKRLKVIFAIMRDRVPYIA